MPDTLTFRQGYFDDPVAFHGLVALLQDIFGVDIGLQNRLGGPDPSSMPFGYFDDMGRCVANFPPFPCRWSSAGAPSKRLAINRVPFGQTFGDKVCTET
ncbi:hypothetical protein [Rhizobium sp. 18065]|uniref:hypothetical protein n=1 Tax=Rhizobium sp. 18065 TaxID=2681411 RepID=UPI0032AFAE2B